MLERESPAHTVVHPTLVTTNGLKYNEYSGDFQKVVTLDDLFEWGNDSPNMVAAGTTPNAWNPAQ